MAIVHCMLCMLLCTSSQILPVVQAVCPCNVLTDPGFVNCSSKKLNYVPVCVPEPTKTLLLSHNRFKTLSGAPFCRFRTLEYLDLAFNNLQYLNNDSFMGLSRLRVLILKSNPLHDNESYAKNVFQPLNNLEELHIEGTCDTNQQPDYDYIDDELSRAPSLKRLYLDGLSRRALGPGFSVLENLEEIHMDGYAGFCMLDSVNNNTFSSLRKISLRKMNLVSCEINFIYPNTFTDLKNLTSLILHDNRRLCSRGLKNLTMVLNTTSLKFLNLSLICKYNQFNISPDVFRGLAGTEIESLDLASNKIEIIDPKAIFMLPKTLKYWSLRDNFINDAQFLGNLEVLVNLITFDASLQNNYGLSATMHSSKSLFKK